jgi:hypothetical protein
MADQNRSKSQIDKTLSLSDWIVFSCRNNYRNRFAWRKELADLLSNLLSERLLGCRTFEAFTAISASVYFSG